MFKADIIPEPPIRFHWSMDIIQTKIIKYKPYSYSTKIKADCRVLYSKDVEDYVNTLFNWLEGGVNSWPFYNKGINRMFNAEFNFKYTPIDNPPTKEYISKLLSFSDDDIIIVFLHKNFNINEYYKLKAQAFENRKKLQIVNIPVLERQFIKGDKVARGVYVLNFGVQLYSKAGGIPWILTKETKKDGIKYEFAKENSLIVGIGFIRNRMNEQNGESIYYGTAQIIDLYGLTQRFEAFTAGYNPTTGYYIPKGEMINLLNQILEYYEATKGSKLENIYIYKSSQFLPEELEAIRSVLNDDVKYYLNYVRAGGLIIRAYDLNDYNGCIRRGFCLYNIDDVKAILWTTGNLPAGDKVRKHRLGTPRSLEINIITNSNDKLSEILRHISYQTLALTKIDWEHATWEVRLPAIFKYSRKASRMSLLLGNITRLNVADLM